MSGLADERLLCADVIAETVEPDGVSTLLATASTVLTTAVPHSADGSELGLWEAGPGRDVDVEVDEVFLVLAGAGTLTFDEDGSRVDLRPGTLVRLVAGDRTTWEVTERLRKLYLA